MSFDRLFLWLLLTTVDVSDDNVDADADLEIDSGCYLHYKLQTIGFFCLLTVL